MHFVSLTFLGFFVLVVVGCRLLRHQRQNQLLLVASYAFYGYWDWRFCGLILGSSLLDWACGQAAGDAASPAGRRKAAVALSVTANLSLLGVFKYLGFFVDSAQALIVDLRVPFGLDSLEVILPVGISFYTFQSLSYTVDVYRGRVAPCSRLDDFLLYVSFFPQLVAGPIERAADLLPQIREPRRADLEALGTGAQLILFGFFKKMVIADNLAPVVQSVYGTAAPSGPAVVLATYAFALQIYCDFSGYTDIARGCARILGFDLRRNFRIPYVATNPSDFWLRWHTSLSSWLRDYLYIPMGGNRGGPWRTRRNLAATMLLGGLWHGASWVFVLWGAYHAALIAVAHVFVSRSVARQGAQTVRSGPRFWVKVALFFQATCVGWLIFRSESVEHLGRLLGSFGDWTLPGPQTALLLVGFGLPIVLLDLHRYRTDTPEPWTRWALPVQVSFMLLLFYAVVTLGTPHAADFLYFRF